MDFEKMSKIVDSHVNGRINEKIKDAEYKAYNAILYNQIADSIGHGDLTEGARQYAQTTDWSQCSVVADSAHGKFVDSVNGVDIYHDDRSGYYFFRPSKVTDNTGDEVHISTDIEGREIGTDDDNNKIVETQTENGDIENVKISPDNEVVQDSAESVAAEWNAKKQAIDEWYNSELANGNTDYGYLASELSRRYDALREEMVAQIPIGGFQVGDSGVDDLSRLMRGEKDPEAEKYDKLGLDSADDFNGFPGSAKKADSKVKDDADALSSVERSLRAMVSSDEKAAFRFAYSLFDLIEEVDDEYCFLPREVSNLLSDILDACYTAKVGDSKIKDASSREMWHGVKGTHRIAPTVYYNAHTYNGDDLENYCRFMYADYCTDQGIDATADGYEDMPSEWFAHQLETFVNKSKFDGEDEIEDSAMRLLNDSVNTDRQAEFNINEGNVMDLINKGTTHLAALNSGVDSDEYAKSCVKVFKEIAEEVGNKLPGISYDFEGNDIIFKVKDSSEWVGTVSVNNQTWKHACSGKPVTDFKVMSPDGDVMWCSDLDPEIASDIRDQIRENSMM